MPRDPDPCRCDGRGWDGCQAEPDPDGRLAARLVTAITTDLNRPLGIRGAMRTDATLRLLRQVTTASSGPQKSFGSPTVHPNLVGVTAASGTNLPVAALHAPTANPPLPSPNTPTTDEEASHGRPAP